MIDSDGHAMWRDHWPSSQYPPAPDESYVCAGCSRRVPNEFGADDDMPDHCDDCWLEAHPEEDCP